MKLHDAVVLGKICGLDTVEECLHNVDLHYWQIIPNHEVFSEREELYAEYASWFDNELDLDWEAIDREVAQHDKEFDDYCRQQHKSSMPEIDLDFNTATAGKAFKDDV